MQALQQKPNVSPQARRVLTMSKVSQLVSPRLIKTTTVRCGAVNDKDDWEWT